jgi:hypothetical protein
LWVVGRVTIGHVARLAARYTLACDVRDVLRARFANRSARVLALPGVMADGCSRRGMLTIRV